MPLQDSGPRIAPINPSSLIGKAEAVVEPRAVAALAEAFRNGQISAEDVLSRASHLSKQKEKLDLQLLSEATSPQGQAARSTATQAATAKNQQTIAQTGATMPLIEPAAGLAAAQIDEQMGLQKYPAAGFFKQYAPALGLQAPLDPDGKPDYAKMAQVGAQLALWQTNKSRAADELKNIKYEASADGTQIIPVTHQGTPVAVSHVKMLQDQIQKPFQFIEPGQAATTPGAAAAPTTPAQPQTLTGPAAQQAADAAEMKAFGTISTYPGENKAALVTPKTPTTAVKPEITPIGTQLGDTSFSLGPPKAKDLQNKAPTEAQQRAELALSRFAQSNDMMNSLKQAGYDPTSIGSWINGMLPQILKNGDRKAYDAAVDAWSQGLLRLESGAAISRQEKGWYERAFFPAVNDPPAVVESKASMRHDVERMVAEIAQAGAVVSPESAAQAKRIYEQAGAAVGAPPVVGGQPQAGQGQPGKVMTFTNGKKFQRDANGQLYQVQ